MGTAAQAARPGAGTDSVTLVLKWVPQAQFAGYFIALDNGYYRQEHLNVTIKPGGPDVTPETVVTGGGAQFGLDWLSGLLVARDKGLPLVNIAQVFQASGMRMITFKSSGINSIAQFRGHKVGVWPAGNEYQFYALMNKVGMSPPQNYMHVVTQLFVMDPFLNHQLDVAQAMTYNELGVVLEHGVKRSQLNIFDYNKLGVSILEDGIMARADYVQSHRDIVVRFLRASIKGWQYAVSHPTQAGQISFSHAPSGTTTLHHQIYMAQQVAKLIKYGPGLSHPIGYMDPALYQRTWRTLLQQKVIHHMPASAYTQVYWKAATGG
ncbi:MAG: ABC transporter substrate-binding protein [Chloroflexi bacterium]|nr:ABC transporter substrate-binding protein [Chloroflexota bacterium]